MLPAGDFSYDVLCIFSIICTVIFKLAMMGKDWTSKGLKAKPLRIYKK